jgi:hypothetical protein
MNELNVVFERVIRESSQFVKSHHKRAVKDMTSLNKNECQIFDGFSLGDARNLVARSQKG